MLSPASSVSGFSGLHPAWEDGDRVFYRGWRDAVDYQQAVLVVLPATNPPTLDSLRRLSHEFELKNELADDSWAARPLEMLREHGRTMLVLGDPGGEPLHRLLATPMEVRSFLRIAVSLSHAVGRLHDRGLVHKDIKPANIITDLATGRAWLTGFGIATRLPRERPAPEPPETIAGTLAYMAPEQTGRMNRSIDSRSDLYALGVTLYQMLTGTLPFTATDPMEWVHCHVAKRAIPPTERVKDVPGAISAIIMKLLAKTAEDRYQTATGLQRDLERCLATWEAQRRIEYFPLGQRDQPDRLLIPEKLYGRESQIKSLLASFDRVVKRGLPELVLVSGYSGVGKSAVVHELHKPLVSSGGLFASGKFDQHQRDIPYATLAQAFQSLVRHLLAKSDADLAPWRDALRQALDPLGRLIIDLVPELQLVIGDQPPVPEAPPQDAQRRFQLVFRRFIGVFARQDHPLALFLDDLQWLDMATLDLLEDLLTRSDQRHLLLIGAYRHNEVGAAHPLARKLDEVRNAGARVQEISLAPLAREGVDQFMTEALRCEPADVAPLAHLMHEKTGGNPFFLIQFLYALAEDALLTFDRDKARWCWDLGGIHAKGYTENVADLMVAKLSGLPADARQALLRLACLRSSAEVATLALVQGTSQQQVHTDLREAVRLGLIEPLDSSYRFVHDRVQEAAYGLVVAEDKPSLHLRIGMALAGCADLEDETSEQLYVIANQLHRGVSAVTSEVQRERIVAVNLAAGRRARAATAYNAAVVYLEFARELLGDKAHPRCSSTAFAIALLRAECEFLVGQPAVAEAQLLVLSQSCPNLQASADVTRLRTNLYTAQGQCAYAVDVCLAFLRQVGIEWRPHPSDREVDEEGHLLRRLAEELSDERLHALPPMTDPDHLATMAVFTDLVTPALLTDLNLSNIVILASARLTLQHGICDRSSYALVCVFSVFDIRYAEAELGLRLARFAVSLANLQPELRWSGRTLMVFGHFATPWVLPIRSGEPFIRRALEIALATGDLTWVTYSHRALVLSRYFCGDPLQEVCKDAEQAIAFAEASGLHGHIAALAPQRNLALSLMGWGKEIGFAPLDPAAPHPLEGTLQQYACIDYIARIQTEMFHGRHEAALALVERGDKLFRTVRAYLDTVEYRFYAALTHAAACAASSPQRREVHVSSLRQHHDKLTIRCAHASANFADRLTLLAAEIARIEGRELDAEQLYEKAIRLAQESGFVQIEAIAAECAARFYEARGIRTVGLFYLAHARNCYLRWGADGKVRQLDEMHPQLREKEAVLGPMNTIGTPVGHLDLTTVLRVSEAVSGEIVLAKLVDTLLRTAIEYAGAERGLLILPQDAELRIEAEATTDDDSVTIKFRDAPISDTELPESLVLYAARRQENVLLDDASVSDEFGNDEYIRRRRARSVLCLPLIKQGKPVALLYLENNLAPRVFTPARVAVLKFLASEAATSLDNARLYRELHERESRIRRLVDANIIGIHIFNGEGVIVDANRSFLKTVGYEREDLIARHLGHVDLTPPEWRERSLLAKAEMEMTGAAQPFEKEYFRRDGSRVPVLIGSAAFDEQRNQGMTFVLDLSERKRAEAEARESERRYREAQMELAHANRIAVMGQLTASIAHEISQPIGAAITYANAALSWLRTHPPDLEEVRQALGFIVESNMRAGEVIERTRALVKKAPARKSELQINDVILEVTALIRGEMSKTEISATTQLAEDLPLVWADRVQLQQLVLNLLINAIEAMSGTSEGTRELLISTEKKSFDTVLVTVRDSGPGFPPESANGLFEPFYTTKPGGLGMGLSICHSIIEAHEGRLWASANLPRGAVVQFTLPVFATEEISRT
jgi:PAS domain S-box-containing protein